MRRGIFTTLLTAGLVGCASAPFTNTTPQSSMADPFSLDSSIVGMRDDIAIELLPRISSTNYGLREPKTIPEIRALLEAPVLPGIPNVPGSPSFSESDLDRPDVVIEKLIGNIQKLRRTMQSYQNEVMGFRDEYHAFLRKQNRERNKK